MATSAPAATQTQQKASSLVKELVERYDRLDRELREVRARGEALEVELKGLQERRARLAERLKWGEERSTAALDQQIRDLKAIIADTRAEFEGLRQRQGELISQAKDLLQSTFARWAEMERRRRTAVVKALEEARKIITPVAAATKEAEETHRVLETLQSFIQCRPHGLPRPGCLNANEVAALLDELRQRAGLSDVSPEEAAADLALTTIARALRL